MEIDWTWHDEMAGIQVNGGGADLYRFCRRGLWQATAVGLWRVPDQSRFVRVDNKANLDDAMECAQSLKAAREIQHRVSLAKPVQRGTETRPDDPAFALFFSELVEADNFSAALGWGAAIGSGVLLAAFDEFGRRWS